MRQFLTSRHVQVQCMANRRALMGLLLCRVDARGYEAGDEYSLSSSDEDALSSSGSPPTETNILWTSPLRAPSTRSNMSSPSSLFSYGSNQPSPLRRFLEMFDSDDGCDKDGSVLWNAIPSQDTDELTHLSLDCIVTDILTDGDDKLRPSGCQSNSC